VLDRAIGTDDDARCGPDGVDQLVIGSCAIVGEQPLPTAQQDRVDQQVELVDQPGLEQRPNQHPTTKHDQVELGAFRLQPPHGVDRIAGQQGGIHPRQRLGQC